MGVIYLRTNIFTPTNKQFKIMPFFYGIFGILSNYIFRDHDKIKFEGEYIHNVIVIVMEREREREREREKQKKRHTKKIYECSSYKFLTENFVCFKARKNWKKTNLNHFFFQNLHHLAEKVTKTRKWDKSNAATFLKVLRSSNTQFVFFWRSSW